jgi:hypothetical protein
VIKWYKTGTNNSTNLTQILNDTNSKYKLVDNQLEISHLTFNDTGIYKCLAFNNFSYNYMKSKYGSIYLSIKSPEIKVLNGTPKDDDLSLPIKIKSNSTKIKQTKGHSVSLNCTWWFKMNITTLDNITFKWFFNNETNEEISNNNKYQLLNDNLIIKNVSINDNSTRYSCFYSINNKTVKISNFSINVGGISNFYQFESIFYLLLFFLLSNLKVAPQIDEKSVDLFNKTKWYDSYDPVSLECPIDGDPKPKTQWNFNEKPIQLNDTNYTLIEDKSIILKIESLQEELQGSYECNSTNEYGSQTFRYQIKIASNSFIFKHKRNNILTFKLKKKSQCL